MQALLLKVFMLIGGRQCSEYINALTASIMLWGHYEAVNRPCWQLFKQNASAFNEEAGEIALSVLARDIARGGVRGDLKKSVRLSASSRLSRSLLRTLASTLRVTTSVRATAHDVSPTIHPGLKPLRLSSRL